MNCARIININILFCEYRGPLTLYTIHMFRPCFAQQTLENRPSYQMLSYIVLALAKHLMVFKRMTDFLICHNDYLKYQVLVWT